MRTRLVGDGLRFELHLRLERFGEAVMQKALRGAECASGTAGELAGEGQRCQDQKSTRLNSSHLGTSYAVFCLKKKKQQREDESNMQTTYTNNNRSNIA